MLHAIASCGRDRHVKVWAVGASARNLSGALQHPLDSILGPTLSDEINNHGNNSNLVTGNYSNSNMSNMGNSSTNVNHIINGNSISGISGNGGMGMSGYSSAGSTALSTGSSSLSLLNTVQVN